MLVGFKTFIKKGVWTKYTHQLHAIFLFFFLTISFSNLLSADDLLELQIVRNFFRENVGEFSLAGLPPPPPPEKFGTESLGTEQRPDQSTRTVPLFKDLSFDEYYSDYYSEYSE